MTGGDAHEHPFFYEKELDGTFVYHYCVFSVFQLRQIALKISHCSSSVLTAHTLQHLPPTHHI